MKCPNCGNENISDICSLCGTQIKKKFNIKQFITNLSLPVKITAIFWTFIWISAPFVENESEVTLGQMIIMIPFGYLICCGIAHLLYIIYKKKHPVKTVVPQSNPIVVTPQYINADYDLLDGHSFEQFCAEVLRKNSFHNVEVTQGSGDHGIDILAEKDGISYAIQCKCYSSNIGNAAVQQAHTGKSIYKKDIAVVLTNRYFTPQAKEEAHTLGVKLWNRDKLNEMVNASKNLSCPADNSTMTT